MADRTPQDLFPVTPDDTLPSVSVVIRSFNRLPNLVVLLERCLAQDYPDFEVVVVEQSTQRVPADLERLERLAADPRLRVLRRDPMGPSAARNEGVRQSRGEIVLFMDDDDLPIGTGWIRAHARYFGDPACLAVTGRYVHEEGEPYPYANADRAYRRCLTFSPMLRLPRCYARQTREKRGVDFVYGGNASVRRSAIRRFGLWDEVAVEGEENSFNYRMRRHKRQEEYLVFSPDPVIVRGIGVPGGLQRRSTDVQQSFWRHFESFHRVVGHYHPVRFVLLYPAYLWKVLDETVTFTMDDAVFPDEPSRRRAARRLVLEFPWNVMKGWWRLLRTPGGRRYRPGEGID